MKDKLGKKIRVNDEVVFATTGCTDIKIGFVAGFTNKSVKIKTNEYHKGEILKKANLIIVR